MTLIRYAVIRDTREKGGWYFDASSTCIGTEVKKLDTGDYTLDGFQSTFVIERKGAVSEFARNLTQDRFMAEIKRLQDITHPFILLEFNMADLLNYPKIEGIPSRARRQIRFKGPAALQKTIEIMRDTNIQIVFCGHRGKDVASSIFKRMIERYDN